MVDLIREIGLIETYFSFLFEKGFRITDKFTADSFDNWIINLKSPALKASFRQDRGDVFLSFAPAWAAYETWTHVQWPSYEHSIDLEIILVYLTGDKDYYPYINQNVSEKNLRMKRLGELTYTYFDQIVVIFQHKEFKEKEKQLHKLGKELLQEFIDSLKKKHSLSR